MGGYTLTYIYHDCFVIETADAILVFDYWKDPLSTVNNRDFPPLLKEIDKGKKIYVLTSHHHKDHFTRRIFLWSQVIPDITYIISRDVFKHVAYLFHEENAYKGFRPPKDSVYIIGEGEVYEDKRIKVTAFGSTDTGNSYAVECAGYTFFHAGDLNAWRWLGESTAEEVRAAESEFETIVREIKVKYDRFDVVMFPVDSRQGKEYWWGAKYFVKEIRTALFVSMHFELVMDEEEKEQRRIDAAAFKNFARTDYCDYLQLSSTRASFHSNRPSSGVSLQ